MKKRYRIPGTEVFILVKQNAGLDVELEFEHGECPLLCDDIEEDRPLIAAMGFRTSAEQSVQECGELVPDPT